MCYRKKKGGCVMQIVGYIKNLDIRLLVALIGFVGVLIGAFISCFTTFCLDWIKFNREEKIYYKRKKEETYIEMQKFITDCMGHWHEVKNGHICGELRIKYNNLRPNAHIYANQTITDEFYDLASDMMTGKNKETYDERNNHLIDAIRKDLKIED